MAYISWTVVGTVNVAEIPQELIDILNERAGKVHRPEGNAIQTLAEILTKYDEIKARQANRRLLAHQPTVHISFPSHNDYYMH